jgi:hypothetical protein
MATGTDPTTRPDAFVPGGPLPADCPACGFRAATVPPGDAVVAVRSFPRRFRVLLATVDDDEAEEVLRRRPGPELWSPLEHVAHVRDVLHAVDKRVQRVLREDDPVLPADWPEAAPTNAHDQGAEVVLATLAVNAEQLARTLGGIAGDDWLRAGRRDGERVTVLDLAREAVHEGAHHRRMVDRLLA